MMGLAVTLLVLGMALCSGWLMSQTSRNAGRQPAAAAGEPKSGTLVAFMVLFGISAIVVFVLGSVK
jgi:hypothetical protein